MCGAEWEMHVHIIEGCVMPCSEGPAAFSRSFLSALLPVIFLNRGDDWDTCLGY